MIIFWTRTYQLQLGAQILDIHLAQGNFEIGLGSMFATVVAIGRLVLGTPNELVVEAENERNYGYRDDVDQDGQDSDPLFVDFIVDLASV